jgi:drug/metabolite transporter (DMT)-like permease
VKAVVLNLMAWAVLPVMDGMAKHLSTEIHFLEVVWGRYFFMVVISVPITFIFFKKHLLWPKNINIQLARSIFLFLSTILFFYAISVISLAESLTLAFVSPLIVTLLSAILLKEQVGYRRWTAVIIGFIGAIIVIRPGFNEISLATFAGLGTGIAYAFYVITTRKLSSIDSPLLTLIFTGLSGVIIISIIVPFVWITPNYTQWLFLIGLASVGTLGHFFLILSLNFAEASKLAPFAYFEIVTNIIIGYYFFGDLPDRWIWIGLIIIVSSGVYITTREHLLKKVKTEPIIR